MKEVVEVRVKNFKELEDAILKNMFDMQKKEFSQQRMLLTT